MNLNLFSISSITSLALSLVIGIFVYLKSPNKKIRNTWLLFCLGAAVWSFGSLRFSTTLSKEKAMFWWQVANIGIISVPALFFHFINNLLNLKKKREVVLWYILAIIFIVADIFYKDNFIGNLHLISGQFYWISWGPNNILHILLFGNLWVFLLPYCFSLMILKYKNLSGNEKNQLRYFMLGGAISWLGGFGNFMSCISPNIYPISNFMVGIFSPILGYAILRHRLMDIRVALTRAGIFIAVYTLVLGLPFIMAFWARDLLIQAFGSYWWMSPLVLMVALATVGPFLYIWLDRRVEERLLKEQRSYQQVLKRASMGMTRIRDLKRLLDLITHVVTKAVRISYAAIYLRQKATNAYARESSRGKAAGGIFSLPLDNPLILWMEQKRQPLIYEEIRRKMEDDNNPTDKLLEANMRLLAASVAIPGFLEDKFIGFFVLGDKVSGQAYTPEDINIFSTLANQASIAIENAQLFNEKIITLEKIQRMAFGIVKSLGLVAQKWDPAFTKTHIERTTILADAVCNHLSERGVIKKEEKEFIIYSNTLHDIGKYLTPEEILFKAGKLDEEEWKIMKQHVKDGADLIYPIEGLKDVGDIVLYSHENYDGTGYYGLKGNGIPIGSRIVALVDSFDAMINPRPYRLDPLSVDEVLKEIEKKKGTQFDPVLTDTFINITRNDETAKKIIQQTIDEIPQTRKMLVEKLEELKKKKQE